MTITPKFDYVEGSFDTDKVSLVCVPSTKHCTVDLCVNDPECGATIPIAEIKLYSSNLMRDAQATFPDAVRLCDEIVRRWNEFAEKHKENKNYHSSLLCG